MSEPHPSIIVGDCITEMQRFPAESIDAIITDPPYGLEFMGKEWDAPWKASARAASATTVDAESVGGFQDGSGGNAFSRSRVRSDTRRHGGDMLTANEGFQAWCEEWALEAFRILKPGGHLLAFGGTRTNHRLATGIENAGFEIRDTLAWLYGSGFPKSLDVSKAIDKAAGAQREVVGTRRAGITPNGGLVKNAVTEAEKQRPVTVAATPEAREWDGWGTALKPAHEPITLARKPLAGTVAANVLAHGTGALNIDACRIEGTAQPFGNGSARSGGIMGESTDRGAWEPTPGVGRWPANVILDEQAAAILDAQTGEQRARGNITPTTRNSGSWFGAEGDPGLTKPGDKGGASRFFYTAKASKRERGGEHNTHPTVKPLALMRWLVRLVAPPGALILDPFLGSGTTVLACIAEGVEWIGIERDPGYADIATQRIDAAEGSA